MKYREVYRDSECRWQILPGFRFFDFSGWRQSKQSHLTRFRPLWIVAEDRSAMRRIWITQEGHDLDITCMAMDDQGRNCGDAQHIRCSSQTQMAQELDKFFTHTSTSAA